MPIEPRRIDGAVWRQDPGFRRLVGRNALVEEMVAYLAGRGQRIAHGTTPLAGTGLSPAATQLAKSKV